MAKERIEFVCTACSYRTPKWLGKCPSCKDWDTLVADKSASSGAVSMAALRKPMALQEISVDRGGEVRTLTGISELDTCLGGGLVAGSLVLLGGDPGVGKSTLLLSAMDRLSRRGMSVLYATGEESLKQVKLRADRLGVSAAGLQILASQDMSDIEAALSDLKPQLVVIDSVQTVRMRGTTGIPGSMSQVREIGQRTMELAKGTGTAILLVGHVTKSGALAGPKALEHFVDTVLHFEGDGRTDLRILRTLKNRFGPAGELGLFEMVASGLREVPDASARLLSERNADVPGTAVVAAMEGTRPLLTEVQALVGASSPSQPARTCVGVDRTRVLLLAAVLEKQGLVLSDRDLFVNAAGGVRLHEPAIDLGIVAAIATSATGRCVPKDTLLFGEVGLVGEVRATSRPAPRLREASRQGFRRVIAPASCAADDVEGIRVVGVRTVQEVLDVLCT